jgi:PST family polysaccharide transporter
MAAESPSPAVPLESLDRNSLDKSIIHSIAWTGAIKWLTQVLSWLSTIVVARLLTPADYGLVAIATAFLGFVTMINEFGLGTTVVTKRALEERQLAQLNSLAVLFGLAGFAVSIALAVPLGQFFQAPELTWVLGAMGTSFLIAGFRIVPAALLEKKLEFKALALIEGCQAIVASMTVIALAWLGFGYWALVVGMIFGTAAWTLLTLRRQRYPFQWPVLASLTDAMTFSWHLIVMRVAWYLSTNADRFIVGKLLGQASVGSYSFACTLANVPLEKVSGLVNRVTPAFFSTMQTDQASIRRYILRLTEGLSLIMFPVTLGLASVADDFVWLVLGDQWKDVVEPLQILACYAAFRSIMAVLSPAILATGLSRAGMLNSVWNILVMLPAFCIGGQWGIVGVALAWMIAHPFVTIPLYLVLFRRIGLSVVSYIRTLWPAVSGCLVMILSVWSIRIAMPFGVPVTVRLSTAVTVGALAYLATVLLLHRSRVMAFVELVRRARSSGGELSA